jgi:hypothetical protein
MHRMRVVNPGDSAWTQDLIIDGTQFSDYAGFVRELNRAMALCFPNGLWDGQDFNDLDNLLESPERYSIRWLNSATSRDVLGHDLMEVFWSDALIRCRESFPAMTTLHKEYEDKVELAAAGVGRTLFDYLVEQLTYPEYCDLILE